MSIADSLEHLTDDIRIAYKAIDEKGGTIPEHKNTENLGDSIASIPSGGGDDDPGDYGIVWYYENIGTDIDDIHADNCSAEITDEGVFAKAVLNSRMGSYAFDDFHLDIHYQQGEGWNCYDILEDPITTEDLETQLGIKVTNFDPATADYASIMIMGKLSIDKTQKPTKLQLQSLDDYNRLADPEYSGGQWELLVPLATIWKFAFGRAVTEIPGGFLASVPNLEYLDTTYADGIITINGGFLKSGSVGIRNDIEFKNATSIGNYCFSNYTCKGAMSFPNVISVGDSCFGNATSMPSLPKVETIGIQFMSGCNVSYVSMNTMPNLRSIGNSAFNQSDIDSFSLDMRLNRMPNLQSIGAKFCNYMRRLENVSLSDGVESLNIDNKSFSLNSTTNVCYLAGIKLTWWSDSTKKQQFINAHPDSSTNYVFRKWR